MSPASEPVVGTSPVVVADGGMGLQVGISPANAETDKTHVKVSVASIRFIDGYSCLRLRQYKLFCIETGGNNARGIASFSMTN